MSKEQLKQKAKRFCAGFLTALLIIGSIFAYDQFKVRASGTVYFQEVHTGDQLAQGLFEAYLTVPPQYSVYGNDQLATAWFRTTTGETSFCLQELADGPVEGGAYSELGTETGSSLYNTFSEKSIRSIRNIIENGYLNQSYWDTLGIPAQCTRQMTQLAIWYIMYQNAEPGSGDKSAGTAGMWTTAVITNSISNRKPGIDAVGQLRTLIQCGQNLTRIGEPEVTLTSKGLITSGNNFVLTLQLDAKYLNGWQLTCSSMPAGATFTINGQAASLKNGILVGTQKTGTDIIKITFPIDGNTGKSMAFNADGLTTKATANIHFFKPTNMAAQYTAVTNEIYRPGPISILNNSTPSMAGNLKITKLETGTSSKLPGAVFGIYRNESCTDEVMRVTTGSDGTITATGLRIGTYYVKEITAPNNYVITKQVKQVTIEQDKTAAVSFENTKQKINLTLTKKDGATQTKLSGAVFALYSDEKCTNKVADLVDKGNGTYTAKNLAQGVYYLKELKAPANYKLNPTVTKITLTGDTSGSATVERAVEVTNELQKITLIVEKKDAETDNPLRGAVFALYSDAGCTNKIADLIDKGDGTYTAQNLAQGTYYLKEIQAPAGYVLDGQPVKVTLTGDTSGSTTVTRKTERTNTPQEVEINLTKQDSENTTAQGEASLDGAVYGLYAKTDIKSPDGTTVLYKAGEKVAEMTTANGGKASVDGLTCGHYYIQEIRPSQGYLLDPTQYDLDVSATTANQEKVITKNILVKEVVIKRAFQIIKVSNNTTDTDMPLLEGAGFTAYPMNTLVYKEDGSVDYEASPKAVIGADGETELFTDATGHIVSAPIPYGSYLVHESTVPENQTAAKDFMVKISEEDCVINQDGICISVKDGPQTWRVIMDKEFNAILRIVKKDAETGQTVAKAGASFKIFSVDQDEYISFIVVNNGKKETIDTFITSEDGTVLTPGILHPGTYRIEEQLAPDGYYNPESDGTPSSVTITIDSGNVSQDTSDDFWDDDLGAYILPVEYHDPAVTGEIHLVKTGDVLTGFEEGKFLWEELPIEGAVFSIVVTQDIYTQDNQGTIYTKDGIEYRAGTKIAELVSDENGNASLSGLPLGSYEIREIEAPNGFLLDDTVHTAILEYAGQDVKVVGDSDGDPDNAFFNRRPKPVPEDPDTDKPSEPDTPYEPTEGEEFTIGIGMYKFSENADGQADFTKPLSGAIFALYNRYDIYNYEGVLIVPADTMLGSATTNEKGLAVFENDFPTNVYMPDADPDSTKEDASKSEFYAIETAAPSGYLLNVEIIDGIRFHYTGSDMPEYTIVNSYQDNDYIKVEITKESTGLEIPYLAGATLRLITNQDIVYQGISYKVGDIVYEWESGEKAQRFDALPAGNYQLVETNAPFGFTVTEPVSFTVTESEKVQTVYMDDPETLAKLTVYKIDTEDRPLAGVKFVLKNETTGETWELITDENGTASSPEISFAVFEDGAYKENMKFTLQEVETIPGYVLNDQKIPVEFTYEDGFTAVIPLEITVENDFNKVQIIKKDEEGYTPNLPDANLQITTEQKITWEGVTYQKGEVVAEWTSETDPKMLTRLPKGTYTLKELSAPFGFQKAEPITFAVENISAVQALEMIDPQTYGKIILNKTDEESGEPLEGVTFEIRYSKDILDAQNNVIHKKGEVADTIVTDENGRGESKELSIGTFAKDGWKDYITYVIVETNAAEGYVKEDTPYEVEITYVDDTTPVVEVEVDITNKKIYIPNLGVEMDLKVYRPWLPYVLGGMSVLIVMSALIPLVLLIRKKKHTNE